jgi:hypothetical protein
MWPLLRIVFEEHDQELVAPLVDEMIAAKQRQHALQAAKGRAGAHKRWKLSGRKRALKKRQPRR